MSAGIRNGRLVILVASCAGLLFADALAAQEHEGADFQRRRQEWFEQQRAYPNAQVDWARIMGARLLVAQRRGTTVLPGISFSMAAGTSWVPMGPGGLFGDSYWGSGPQLDAGRVDAIAVHPTNVGTMFIASPNGGIWGTTDGGADWSPLTDNQCTLQMSKVTIDPVNPNLVYAMAGFGVHGCGILRSTDGGSSWENYSGNLFTFVSGYLGDAAFYIDPGSAGSTTSTTMVVAFGNSGIYRSTDSGASWSKTFDFGFVTSIVGLPGKPGVVFAGVADWSSQTSARSGLYRSSDNGLTWTRVASGTVDFSSTERLQLAVSPAEPNAVWVLATSKSEIFESISRWDDEASQLTRLTAGGIDPLADARTNFGHQGSYDLALAVDPSDPRRIYVAGVRAFRSTDGGATFTPMATEIHSDWHTIVVDPHNPRQLYAGTDGGVFVSPDGGSTWSSRNAGLMISMYYPGISQHPTDPGVVLGGLQDNGSMLSNGTPYYNSVSGGDGGYSAIDYSSPSTVWTEVQFGWTIQRRTATATGYTYDYVTSGIVSTDRRAFIPPLVMDPVTPTTLYFGTYRLYRLLNATGPWAPITGDLTKGSGVIDAIAVAPSDPQTIYVGTRDGNVQVSRDGGATFTLSTGLPNRSVTDFAIDRSNAARALVTFSGYVTAHVYLTTDAGQTWTNVSGNLLDIPVNAGVMIDDGPNHFFVGTDAGVFESTDGGLSWNSTPPGMPNVVVHDLSYNPATKQLVAATYGRGLFRYSFATPLAVLRGDVDRSGAVDAFDALLTQQAIVGLELANGLTALPHGDTNCDSRLETSDVLITLRASVGLTTTGACVGTVR